MYDFLSTLLCRFAVNHNIISAEDSALYKYAYSIFLAQLTNWISLMILALLFDALFPVALFITLFVPLRTYAGGRHASTYGRCYLFSLGISLIQLSLCKFLASRFLAKGMILPVIAAVLIIFLRAPVADPNKPINEKDAKIYKKRARLIVVTELAAICFCSQFPVWNETTTFMISAPVLVALLLLIPERKVTE